MLGCFFLLTAGLPGFASGQDILPGTPYLQYQTFDPMIAGDGYTAWAPYFHSLDGSPTESWEFFGPPVLSYEDGSVISHDSSYFMYREYIVGWWDSFEGKFQVDPVTRQESGYILSWNDPQPDLAAGMYAFDINAYDETAIDTSFAYFPEKRALSPVDVETMAYNWENIGGSLYLNLSWNPVSDTPFIDFDRYQIVIYPFGNFMFSGEAQANETSVKLDPVLLQKIADMAGGSPASVEWIVETRAYDGPYNFARSRSAGVDIPWLNAPPPEPPANDLFNNATIITDTPFEDNLDTSGATGDSDDEASCSWGYVLPGTVWYAYTAPEDLHVVASTQQSDYETAFNVMQGEPGSFSIVACDSSGKASFTAVAGETYYFMIGALPWSERGQLNFSLTTSTPLKNDLFNNATIITDTPFEDILDTRGATADPDDKASCSSGYVLQGTVWYAYTAPEDLYVTASTQQSDYEAVFNVMQGEPGSFSIVACDSSGKASFTAVAGETYYFMIGALPWIELGQLNFSLTTSPPLRVEVSLNPVGSFNTVSGSAIISGEAICSRPVDIYVSGTVRQTLGRRTVIEAWFGTSTLHCDGTIPWEAAAMSDTASFGGGRAYVHLYAGAYDPNTGESANFEMSEVVHLRGGK